MKYYQDKKITSVPHKVTQAINEGKEPVIGNDGNLYLIDESKGFAIPASIYEKTSSANNKPSYFKHPIAKGQTLSELAKHFKMSEKELLDANKDSVTNRHQIKESNYLNIPITPKNVHLFNNNAHYANNNQPSATFATNQDYTVSSNFVENMMQCGDGISCDSNGFDLSEAINDYVSKERQTLDGIKSEKNQASTELLLSLVDIPQILPDISDISLVEAVDKTPIAKMYFLWKNVAKVGYIMGKEQLASNYPALYKSLANTGNYIGDKIAFVFDNGDNIMHFISGDDYTDLKNNIKNGFDSLPVIGKDLTLMKLGEASGKVVWKATSSSVGAISKPLFNKIDELKYTKQTKLEIVTKFTEDLKIDISDKIKNLHVLRQEYIKEVELGLKQEAIKIIQSGKSIKETAIELSQLRREVGIKYKEKSLPEFNDEYLKANLKKYGDEYGPTIEWFRNKGRSWEQIVESSCKTGGRNLPGTK